MSNRKPWPSRRLQIGIFILLAVGAVITVFIPPFSKEQRAQRLYEDAWFADFSMDESLPPEKSVPKLEKALELCPGNSIYEQGLVWNYPEKDLPKLLKERKLGSEAVRLAYGRIYTKCGISLDIGSSNETIELQKILKLREYDSRNSLAYYFAAGRLAKAHRLDAAYHSVQEGNTLGRCCLYVPETTKAVSDTIGCYSLFRPDFRYRAELQSVARGLGELGHERLRKGDLRGACDAFETCCRMGANYACARHVSGIDYFVGQAIFRVGWDPLKKICKDFGMREELAEYSQVEKAFGEGNGKIRKWLDLNSIVQESSSQISIYSIPLEVTVSMAVSLVALIILALSAFIWRLVMKAKKQPVLRISPWEDGWLIKTFLVAYSAVLILTFLPKAIMVVYPNWTASGWMLERIGDMVPIVAGMVITQLAVLLMAVKKMRREFVDNTGEKIGMLTLVFRGTASRCAWMSGSLVRATGVQIMFLIASGFLTIILFKPLIGVHPWQLQRIPCHAPSKEAALVKNISENIAKACPADWHMER